MRMLPLSLVAISVMSHFQSNSCHTNMSRTVIWVVVAYAIASYTHLFHTIFTDKRILRPIFHLSLALFSINIVFTFYLTVYLPFKFPVSLKFKTPASSPAFWEVYCPRVIPIMTACGIVGSCLLVRACYPVWGFLAPFILGVVALGMFFSLHFIPWRWWNWIWNSGQEVGGLAIHSIVSNAFYSMVLIELNMK